MSRRKDSGQQPSGFAQKLRQHRLAAGLTQVELAEKAGLAPSSLSKLERGTNEPGWPEVVKIARALGLSTECFIPQEGEAIVIPETLPKGPRPGRGGRPRKGSE